MRPGCEQARIARRMRREEDAELIRDLLMLACLAIALVAIYWSMFD